MTTEDPRKLTERELRVLSTDNIAELRELLKTWPLTELEQVEEELRRHYAHACECLHQNCLNFRRHVPEALLGEFDEYAAGMILHTQCVYNAVQQTVWLAIAAYRNPDPMPGPVAKMERTQ